MIPVCIPVISDKEIEYVTDCLKTNWISSRGKYVEQFEKRFAEYCNMKHGVSTTNGTTALHLALASLDIGPGDEVILPSFTIISTALAVIYCGAKPVLVDSEPETWNIDVDKIEEKISKKTKAILPVHIYGHPCDMDPIIDIAERHKLLVVEDAAEVHGAEYKGKKAGSFGDISCFSFYSNKIITTGEGGMILTDDDKIAQKARSLKNLAHSNEKRFYHKEIGFNYRMTNIQAAIGLAQLEKIEEFVNNRRNNALLYNKYLKDVEGIETPIEKEWAKNVYWMYSIIINDKYVMTRDQLIEKLKQEGIETRTFFIPMHQQKIFKKMGMFNNEKYPIADKISDAGLYLPSSSGLKKDEIKFICEKIQKITYEKLRLT